MANKPASFEQSLKQVVDRLDKSDIPRQGDVVFHIRGDKPFRVALKPVGKSSMHRTLTKEAPRLEISGDPERIQAVLEGKKDPRQAFLEGSMTVRGDLDYLQSVLRSLGLMT